MERLRELDSFLSCGLETNDEIRWNKAIYWDTWILLDMLDFLERIV